MHQVMTTTTTDGTPKTVYYYEEPNTLKCYTLNPDGEPTELTDCFTITNYEHQLRYQETGEKYPYDYVKQQAENHSRDTTRNDYLTRVKTNSRIQY